MRVSDRIIPSSEFRRLPVLVHLVIVDGEDAALVRRHLVLCHTCRKDQEFEMLCYIIIIIVIIISIIVIIIIIINISIIIKISISCYSMACYVRIYNITL